MCRRIHPAIHDHETRGGRSEERLILIIVYEPALDPIIWSAYNIRAQIHVLGIQVAEKRGLCREHNMRFDENMRLEPKIANIVNTQKYLVVG